MSGDEGRDELARLVMGYDLRELSQVYVGDEANWSSSLRRADVILASAWLARVKREAAADAWDEGYAAEHGEFNPYTGLPYRHRTAAATS